MSNPNNDPNRPEPATYKGSENVPSVRTLAPVPAFPKLDSTDRTPVPESALSPATLTTDKQGQTTGTKPGETFHLVTRQISPSNLLPPITRFNPVSGQHELVASEVVDERTPVTANPVHRPLTGGI